MNASPSPSPSPSTLSTTTPSGRDLSFSEMLINNGLGIGTGSSYSHQHSERALKSHRVALRDGLFRLAVLVALAFVLFAHTSALALPVALAVAGLMGWFHARQIKRRRFVQLMGASAVLGFEDSGPDPLLTVPARLQQATRAMRDTSPFIHLGTALGVLTEKMDAFAPDPGLPFGLSVADLSTHLLVFGTNGTGKTSCVLRPGVQAWLEGKAGGLLLLDGKAVLPAEFTDLPGYTLLDPRNPALVVPLLAGLDPQEAAGALAAAQPQDTGEHGAFFTVQASTLLLNTLVILEALIKTRERLAARPAPQPLDEYYANWRWTIADAARLLSLMVAVTPEPPATVTPMAALLNWVATVALQTHWDEYAVKADSTSLWQQAIAYATQEIVTMDPKTRGNIESTLRGWISPLMQHRLLIPWAAAESGVDITRVLVGERMGVLLPESTYRQAGTAASALIRARLYKAVRERGDLAQAQKRDPNQVRVLICIDEAQDLFTSLEENLLPLARSLGAVFVCATQNLDRLRARFPGGGGSAATAMLDNFASIVSLRTSPDTYDYLGKRAGEALYKRTNKQTMGRAWLSEAAESLSTATFDPSHPLAAHAARLRGYVAFRDVTSSPFRRAEPVQVGWEKGPLVAAHEIHSRLATPFVGLAMVIRGGVPRRDFIQMRPQFEIAPSGAKQGGTPA